MGRVSAESESALQSRILEGLKMRGVWSFRVGRNKRRGKSSGFAPSGEDGVPDIWTEYGWIEVKLPGEDLSPDQVAWHDKARRRGVNAGVARSGADAFDLIDAWKGRN